MAVNNCKYVVIKKKCECRVKEGPFNTHTEAALNVNVQDGSWYYLEILNEEWTYSAGIAGPFYSIRDSI